MVEGEIFQLVETCFHLFLVRMKLGIDARTIEVKSRIRIFLTVVLFTAVKIITPNQLRALKVIHHPPKRIFFERYFTLYLERSTT